jgi:hypothetical protein
MLRQDAACHGCKNEACVPNASSQAAALQLGHNPAVLSASRQWATHLERAAWSAFSSGFCASAILWIVGWFHDVLCRRCG